MRWVRYANSIHTNTARYCEASQNILGPVIETRTKIRNTRAAPASGLNFDIILGCVSEEICCSDVRQHKKASKQNSFIPDEEVIHISDLDKP